MLLENIMDENIYDLRMPHSELTSAKSTICKVQIYVLFRFREIFPGHPDLLSKCRFHPPSNGKLTSSWHKGHLAAPVVSSKKSLIL